MYYIELLRLQILTTFGCSLKCLELFNPTQSLLKLSDYISDPADYHSIIFS